MLSISRLGDFKSDFVSIAGVILGKDKAAKIIDDLGAYVKEKAAEGAGDKVKPLAYAAIAAGALGLLAGVGAMIAYKRGRR